MYVYQNMNTQLDEPFVVGVKNRSAEYSSTYYEGPYIPDGVKKLIYMYLSSYSDIMSDNKTPVYLANGSAYWRDLQKGEELFNIIGTNLPTKLRNPPMFGINMSGVRMIGPPSENVAFPNSGYVLPSISVCFFAKWRTVNLTAPLILLRMYAETPNHVSVTVSPVNDTTVRLSIVCGLFSKTYDWDVPKSTLLTQGPGTLYTFVYNKDANTVTFYVGATALPPKTLDPKTDIKLSNSPIEVNYSQNWDAELQALVICRGVVTPTDITSTTEYFLGLSSGKQEEVQKLKENTKQLSENLESCNSQLPKLLAEIENLQGEVRYNAAEITHLRKRVAIEKKACAKAAAGRKEFQWLIKNGMCPRITAKIDVPSTTNTFKHAVPTVTTAAAKTSQIGVKTQPPKEKSSSWFSWFGRK